MRKLFPALFAIALTLASCSTSNESGEVETSSTTTTTSSSTEATSTTSSSSAATTTSESTAEPSAELTVNEPEAATSPVPPSSDAPTDIAPAAPVQQESIFNSPGVGYQCPATDAYVDDPALCTSANLGGDPIYDTMYPGGIPANEVPYADGGTCAAAICGYGHDEFGNPNPSSGEIQAEWACQQGTLTDPAICSDFE